LAAVVGEQAGWLSGSWDDEWSRQLDELDRRKGTKVRRYNWHSAGSLGWPFPTLKYKYIFPIKYTETFLSNRTRKLLWFEIVKMLIAV